jgi:hypothetical protein
MASSEAAATNDDNGDSVPASPDTVPGRQRAILLVAKPNGLKPTHVDSKRIFDKWEVDSKLNELTAAHDDLNSSVAHAAMLSTMVNDAIQTFVSKAAAAHAIATERKQVVRAKWQHAIGRVMMQCTVGKMAHLVMSSDLDTKPVPRKSFAHLGITKAAHQHAAS